MTCMSCEAQRKCCHGSKSVSYNLNTILPGFWREAHSRARVAFFLRAAMKSICSGEMVCMIWNSTATESISHIPILSHSQTNGLHYSNRWSVARYDRSTKFYGVEGKQQISEALILGTSE